MIRGKTIPIWTMSCWAFCNVFVAGALSQEVSNSEDVSSLLIVESRPIVQLGLDGTSMVRLVNSRCVPDPLAEYAQLANKAFLKGLGVSTEVEVRLTNVVAESQKFRRLIVERSMRQPGGRVGLLEDIDRKRNEIKAEIEEILGESGKSRYRELELQKAFRIRGLIGLAADSKFVEWELTPDERERILVAIKTSRERLHREVKEFTEQLAEAIGKIVGAERGVRLESMLKNSSQDLVSIEILVSSIEQLESGRRFWYENDSPIFEDKLKQLLRCRHLLIDDEGQISLWSPVTSYSTPETSLLLSHTIYVYEQLVLGDLGETLRISDFQKEKLYDQLGVLMKMEESSVKLLEDFSTTPLFGQVLMYDFLEARKNIAVEQLGSILKDQQEAKLLRYIELSQITASGVIPSLVDGMLGDELELDQEQKKAIATKATDLAADFISKLKATESQLRELQLKALDEDHRRETVERIGKWNEHWPPSMVIILLQLSSAK